MKVTLSDTSRAQNVGKKLECDVYVTGKGSTPFIIPKLVSFDCAGVKRNCQLCSFSDSRCGELLVQASSRNILALLGRADSTVAKQLRIWMGVCEECRVRVKQTQNIEEIRVSPRMDTFLPSTEYVTRECYFLGHGLLPNRPYTVVCYCYPDPTTQRAVLVAEKASPLRDMIETFKFAEVYEKLRIFQKSPYELFPEVYRDLTSNVHRIVGRAPLQYAFDLVFHSVLQFRFQGVELRRGWVEGFILGDSGQGKTEMSLCLLNHYGLGDRIQGEGASTAGLIGGLEKMGDRWILVWGRIPQMDKRLLIIDEFGGISEEDVAKMSDIRATGIAEITKIRTERASARTRLVMMSNTRDGQPLGTYNTGVEALKVVFGHAEDVRRLDFALCVATSEVSIDMLNNPVEVIPHKYKQELCRSLILWAWSRTPRQVKFESGVEDLILREAVELSGKYSAFIPLIEPADTRIKLARLTVSCACRCFSSDEKGNVIVKPEHVEFVVEFLKDCYDSPFMSYDLYSARAKSEAVFSDGEYEQAVEELRHLPNWKECVDILSSIGNPFRGYEVGEQLGIDSWDVRDIIRFLSKHRMIQTLPAGYRKLPKMNTFLRRVQSGVQNNSRV